MVTRSVSKERAGREFSADALQLLQHVTGCHGLPHCEPDLQTLGCLRPKAYRFPFPSLPRHSHILTLQVQIAGRESA